MCAASLRKIRFIQDRIHLTLFIIHTVAHGKTLSLDIPISAVRLPFPEHTGIHQQMPAVRKRYRAPGETSVPVTGVIRRKCRRKVFPVQEVTAYRMSPVHRSPFCFIRIILIKHMILPIVV